MAGGDRTNSEVLVYRLRNTVTDHWVAQTSRLLRCLRSIAAHMADCTMCAPPKAAVLLFRNRSTSLPEVRIGAAQGNSRQQSSEWLPTDAGSMILIRMIQKFKRGRYAEAESRSH